MRPVHYALVLAAAFTLVPALAPDPATADCVPFASTVHEIGRVTTEGAGNRIARLGSLLLVAELSSGLQVIDVSNPTAPAVLATVNTGGGVVDVAAAGQYAYLVGGTTLRVVDLANPAQPVPGATLGLAAGGLDIALAGTRAYVVTSQGLSLFDLASPAQPVAKGSCSISNAAAVAVSGNYAYVVGGFTSLTTVNVSNPDAPSVIGTTNDGFGGQSAVVDGSRLFVNSLGLLSAGLRVLNLTNPAAPVLAGAALQSQSYGSVASSDLAISNGRAVVRWNWGVLILDVTVTPPVLVGGQLAETQFSPPAIATDGNRIFFADSEYGEFILRVVDASTPAAFGRLGGIPPPYAGVARSGSLAFVASSAVGLRLFDVSNPAAPALAGSVDTPGSAADVAVAGGFAYIADGSGGLQIADVSNPTTPGIVGSLALSQPARQVVVQNGFAYVKVAPAVGSTALEVVDVSVPATPAAVTTVPLPYGGRIALAGSRLYYATDQLLQIYDISVPATPALLGSVALSARDVDVSVHGDLAYVTGHHPSTLEIVGVTVPSRPTIARWMYIGPDLSVYRHAVHGRYLYLAQADGFGLQVFDVTNPFDIESVTSIPVEAGAYTVTIAGDLAFVGTGLFTGGDLWIVPVICPEPTDVAQNRVPELRLDSFPNPIHERATLHFELARPGAVQLDVLDVAGRRVRRVWDGALGVGPHAMGWDGRDAAGRRVASGIYWVRLVQPDGATANRVTIAR